ncbi:hypothetical protein [Niastella populi]|nr:hypothetical protein [Niastella populi]
MKKKAILFMIAIVIAITGTNIFAKQTTTLTQKVKPALINYAWYADEDFMVPVGTHSDINVEMNRLRNLFPYNIFSATPFGMLNPYEFGYNEYSNTSIIYSDL